MENLKFELLIFKLLYLFMNCDNEISSEELLMINNIIDEYDSSEKKQIIQEIHTIDTAIEQGFSKIREHVIHIAEKINSLPETISKKLSLNIIQLLKNMIIADGKVHPNEYSLFQILCKKWDIEEEIDFKELKF